MRKLVFLDIDGTTVSHKSNPSRIPESTKETIRLLRLAGHAVAFATGRSRATSTKPMDELDVSDAVFCNGSHIKMGGKTAFIRYLESTIVQQAVKHVRVEGSAAFAADTEKLYICNVSGDSLAYLLAQCGGEANVKPMEEMGDACKLEYYGTRLNGLSEGRAELLEAYGGIELRPPGTSKEDGIRRFAEFAGFSMADVVAVGDERNDIGMLKAAGVGIAVGGSPEDVVAAADIVADAIEDGGIYKAFKQLKLI
jgi:HAD superfamily hydrolase (TIGR01484 family)